MNNGQSNPSGNGSGVFDPLAGEKPKEEDDKPQAAAPTDAAPVIPFRENLEAIRRNWHGDTGEAKAEPGSKAGKLPPAKRVEFFSPLELINYKIPEDYAIIGDFHITKGGIVVIGGAQGIGKSRAATALAIAGATGQDWFGLKTHRRFKTMILQAENGRPRLKTEYEGIAQIDPVLIEDWIRVSEPPPRGMDFQDVQFRCQFSEAVKTWKPDVVIIDPWNRVVADEQLKAYSEAYESILGTLPDGDQRPALVIVAHTRKPRMGERAAGRALANMLSGSYMLSSVARSVFILQAASDDGADQRIVFTPAKNNDGEIGKRSAWLRRNGLFDSVEGFDWPEFERGSGSGGREAESKVTNDHMRALFDYGQRKLERPEAVAELRRMSGCGQTKAYDALKTDGEFAAMLRWYPAEKKLGIILEPDQVSKSKQMKFEQAGFKPPPPEE